MDMKRLLFCICAMMTVVIALAEDVTPAEALKQATQFVQNRIASGQHSRRAVGTQAQLTQTGKVSGLYVFNVDNNGGFVIVSNDDRTEPVLGYSDSGSFDPDNMPENMRAWLQGYADEIAWLKKHPDAAVSSSRRTGESNIKTPIEPLVETKWNQGEPYNDQCPYYYEKSTGGYSYSIDYKNNYEHCATGCVATAMAQVMNYHQWPVRATKNISSYTWKGNDMPSLAPVNFDWDNMINNYSNGYTTAQATAVATLMKHCGYSLEMNYGPSSGSNTDKVASALKNYFNYSSTVTYVSRSFYTYANWIEMMYHELSQGRPVVYGGSSTGGGHEFVCDGYQGEDYFHINWGWGGMSDNYFKLSALDPDAQGIGGSSSDDGFHFGQDAVIGIQKNGGTGTVLEFPTTNYNLSLNSINVSQSSVQVNEPVEVTLRVTNSGPDDYDGDIWLYASGLGLLVGKTFLIPAGTTKDCVITYTPSGFSGTISLQAYIPGSDGYYYRLGNNKSVNLTVTSGGSMQTTTDVDLSVSGVTISNYELVDNTNVVYGRTLKGELTITNKDPEKNFSSYFEWALFGSNGSWLGIYSSGKITIPAGESIQVPFNVDNLSFNTTYIIGVCYYRNGDWTDWSGVGQITMRPGITTYAADGSKTVNKLSGTSYDAATDVPNALVVVITGTGISSITPNSQPNCLYILGSSDTEPSGLDNKNVIKYDGDKYTAQNITLKDGNDFYSPVDFTAQNVEFTYNFTVAADGTNGWNTLMLPFNVTKVTATDPTTNETKEIDWFHNADNTGKNFWVKEFTSDAGNTVNFDFADEMKANTPYIVAFPGDKWGAKWDMSNKELRFIGEKVTVSKGGTMSSTTGSSYRFIGNTVQDNTQNIYSLNADGNAFETNAENGSAPFRAYFKPGIYDRTVNSLAIGSEPSGTTGIEDVNLNDNVNDNDNGNFFNLNGQRVTHPTKGLYISNGKKVIIK